MNHPKFSLSRFVLSLGGLGICLWLFIRNTDNNRWILVISIAIFAFLVIAEPLLNENVRKRLYGSKDVKA